MQKALDVILRRNRPEPAIPVCPDHKVEMRLRGKMGRPTRFNGQTEEQYEQVWFCPVTGCDHTKLRTVVRTQIPVPGEQPARPEFSRDPKDNSL